MSETQSAQHGEHIGMVKWFNYKLGYGFVTVTLDGSSQDIFIHQSNVRPNVSKYRTLSAGEYVSLDISTSEETRQAVNVTGVHGGPLRCDHEQERRQRRRANDREESSEPAEEQTN
jgi:cold shock CspA family protein